MTDENTQHDPWPEAFTAAVAASGQTEDAVSRRLYLSRWRADQLLEALAKEPNWFERLDREARIGSDAARDYVAKCVDAALEHGPRSLAGMGSGALLALAAPRLRDFVATYQPAEHGGALITGPTAVGKTVTAAALLLRSLRPLVWESAVDRLVLSHVYPDGLTGSVTLRSSAWGHLFVRAADLDSARRQHPLGEGEAPLVTEAMEATLLVLDDLGHERDFAAAWDVLAARYDHAAPTIVTSGWPLEKLAEKYGAAAVRRITEAGPHKGRVVEVWDA